MPVYQRESREAVSLRLRYPRAGNRVLVTGLVTVVTPRLDDPSTLSVTVAGLDCRHFPGRPK
jgi:hypothetical protein